MAPQQTPGKMSLLLALLLWYGPSARAQPEALVAASGVSNCAALAGSCVCIGDDVAQCVDTNAVDLSFLRGLRNRTRFSEVIVYHNSIPTLRNATFQHLQLTNLRTIRLAYNGIVTVEPRAFQGLRKLKKLVLVRNNIRALHATTFDNAIKLSLIDLSNNQISEINAVRYAPNLEDVRLANNSISELSPRAFCSAQSCRIRSINLANNQIHQVNIWAFHGLQNLESLNLSENKILSFHYLTFSNTSNLKELDVRRNRISTVDFVCGIQNLKYLFLSENRITHVANDTFVCGHQSSLVHIDLSGNKIVTIEPAAFHGLYSVWDLLLARNRLSSIHPATFLNCTNLKTLDLRYNRISTLHFVRDIIMLWNLDLSFNEIETVPSGTFKHHNLTQLLGSDETINGTNIKFVLSRTITNINFAHNRLTSLERGDLEGLYKLFHLDVSWNNISYMSADVFQLHSEMTRLNIQGNRLTSFEAMLSAPNLSTCDASNNAISVLPDSFTEILNTSRVRQLHLSSNSISYLHPRIFTNFSHLCFLNLTDNNLNTTNFVSSAIVLENLYLAKNKLSFLPQNAFSSATFTSVLKSIDVSHNKISTVHEGAFQGLHSLLFLNMSYNYITSISQGAFRTPAHLQELDLSNNRLTRVEFAGALVAARVLLLGNNSVASVGGDALRGARALQAVDLSGNALSALPDAAFADLPQLQHVDLSRNRLQRVAPGAFRNASRLRTLRLRANRLQALDFLRQHVALEELDLAHNQVSWLPEPLVGGGAAAGAPRLTRLNLAHNSLSSLAAGALRHLGALHALELQGNALAHVEAAALAHCGALLQLGLGANRLARLSHVPHLPRLKHLYVFGNRLRRLSNDSFGESRLTQVVHLNVSSCSVAEVEGGAFRPLRMLRYLDLSRNHIASLPDGVFASNTLLSALDLSGNRLHALSPQLLRHCVCLEFLDASSNALRALPQGVLRDQLRYLDLSRNAIAAVAPAAFDGLRRLEVVDLSWNNLSSASPLGRLPDGSALLLAGHPGGSGANASSAHEKRLFNLYDISTSELDKFAKLYMWILQSNNSVT